MPKITWTNNLRKVYSKYPATIRDERRWGMVIKAANSGDLKGAMSIAKEAQDNSTQVRAQNIMARKIRIERVKFFMLQSKAQQDLRGLMDNTGKVIISRTLRTTSKTPSALARKRQAVAEEIAVLRRKLNTWFRGHIWNSTLMGIRQMEQALLPVFKDNEESHKHNLEESTRTIELLEEPLSFGLADELVKRTDPRILRNAASWLSATKVVFDRVTKKAIQGLKPSERIWDLTKRAELDLQRLVQSGISEGRSANRIARDIEDYLSPKLFELGIQSGVGVYKSPFKNAMRLARTEANRAYTFSQAAWAENKSWVKGLMITLSPAHAPKGIEDVCDDFAGKIVSPQEFRGLVPFHPHCMCFAVVVFEDRFLETGQEQKLAA